MTDIIATTSASGTQTMTSVPSPHQYDNWGVINIVLAGLVGFVFFLGALLGVIKTIHEFFRARRDGEKERDAPIENRVTALEQAARTFRPVDQLDKDFARLENDMKHMKSNLQSCDDSLANQIRSINTRVEENERAHVRIQTQFEGLAANSSRVELAVERLGERFEERFDKLQTILAGHQK